MATAPPQSAIREANATKVNPEQSRLALEYLEKHRIPQLMQHLTAAALCQQPKDLKGFLIQELENIRSSRESSDPNNPAPNQNPAYYSETNLQAVFQVYDRNGTGYMSQAQYESAMSNLGVSEFERQPRGVAQNRITAATFVAEARTALKQLPDAAAPVS